MNNSREILSVSFFHDIPRAYIFKIGNQTFLRGPYAETVKNFARYQNFDLHFEVFDDVPGVYRIYSDIYHKIFNMSTYSTTHEAPDRYISYSYPLERNKKCVMVPFSQEIPHYLYILWPFGPYIWLCLTVGIFYIGILMHFISKTSMTQKVAQSIVRNIPHALNISLYTNNMGLNIKQAPWRTIFFYGLLYLYGFIISAYHLPYLTSFCMKPLFMKSINTVDDILNSHLPIIIKNTSFRELRHSMDRKWPILKHRMVNVSGMYYQALLRNFDRYNAYVVALDQWNFIDRQQQHLKKPIFHLSQVCFSSALRSLPLQAHWPYIDSLNIYLMRVKESGFWQHWIEMAFTDAVFNGDAEILLDTHPVEPLTLEFFTIAWFVIIIGAAISLVVNIFENLIWRHQKRSKKHKMMRLKILRKEMICKRSSKKI